MRSLVLRCLFHVFRALRPRGKRQFKPLSAEGTVLFLQYAMPLGCCVHGTPLIEALAAAAPGVRIVVATRRTGAETLRHSPFVSELLITADDPMSSIGALWRTARAIRARGYRPDVIVQDASSRRGFYALLALALRLAPTVGFANAVPLYDRHLAYDETRSLIDNNLRAAGELGGDAAHREPAVFFTEAELDRVRRLLVSGDGSRGVVGFVVQGSGGQRTGWHDERFGAVVQSVEAAGFATVFLGTPADAGGIERIRLQASSSALSLAGQTSVAELAAVLCLCDLVITVDTGTMHVGRAVGVPMVVLGPSWQRPLEWLPLGRPDVRILRGPDRAEAPPDYRLDEIEVPDVAAAAEKLLATYPPSTESRAERVRRRLTAVRR